MRALFNWQRMGIFWWGLITALVFMIPESWTFSLGTFLRSIDTRPFNFIKPVSDEIDNATRAVLVLVQFDPSKALVCIGVNCISNLIVGVILAVLFFTFAVLAYFRAAATESIFDDFLAIAFIYIVMRIIGVASDKWSIGFMNYVHNKEPISYLIILSIFMLILLVRGKGFVDSEVFFKTIFEAIVVWTLILPSATLLLLAWIVERPAALHKFLTENPIINSFYPMVVAVWAIVGLSIVAVNLYSAGRVPVPAGGGGGGKKEA